jgi:DNA-directed RNA polymerase specialized sigma24 family protein
MHAWQYRNGRITEGQFFHATKKDWEHMARYLLKRWKAPTWYEADEVEQELKLAAWKHVWKYEGPENPPELLAKYVIWNALDGAKKKLHKARGAILHGNADSSLSRFETPTDFLDWGDLAPSVQATQLEDLEAAVRLATARSHCRNTTERIVLDALVDAGDIVGAAVLLYEREDVRAACGLVLPQHAGYLAADVAHELVRRLEEAEAA